MKNALVQFRKWYLILRPRKCQKHECRRYPRFTPLCPWKFEFRKCRNRFLGIFVKNVLVQFRRRYLISRSRKSQKDECQSTPFLPFKIKILQNPFSAHLYTPIPTYPQNIMSLTLIVRTSSFIYIVPPFYPFVPLKIRISKMLKLVLGIL